MAAPDLATVHALCMLQLAARRLGCSIRVHDATPELRELIILAGLEDVLLVPDRRTVWPMRALGTTASPKPSSKVRMAALGGVIGPAAFIGAWTVSAAVTTREYSSIDDAISRLAAVGADTRPLMTAGFVGFGLALPVYASALRRVVGGAAWLTAAATGIATLAVAATPLERSTTVDTWHGIVAGIGYVTIAATPLLAASPLRRHGHRTLAGLGLVAGAVSAIALVLTTTTLPSGLFQRLGLTAADIWIATSGIAIASGRLRVMSSERVRNG